MVAVVSLLERAHAELAVVILYRVGGMGDVHLFSLHVLLEILRARNFLRLANLLSFRRRRWSCRMEFTWTRAGRFRTWIISTGSVRMPQGRRT